MNDPMTIGELARAAGVNIQTLRYYERSGLLPEPPRSEGGYRLYDRAALDRVRFLRRARRLGFTLAEAQQLLELRLVDGDRGVVRERAREKLDDIQRRIDELVSMRDALEGLVRACDGHGPAHDCPILEAIAGEEVP